MKVHIACQCTDQKTGTTGDYGFIENPRIAVTPIFNTLSDLFNYLKKENIDQYAYWEAYKGLN